MKDSVSIIITAYNEEDNIAPAVRDAIAAALPTARDYEIVIVDDGSVDDTLKISNKLAKRNRRIKIAIHPHNLGLGAAFKTGISKASKTYVCWFPGDNDSSGKSLGELIQHRHEADIITSYTINPGSRSLFRQAISGSFVLLMNLMFRLNLRYYNGTFICKRSLLQSVPLFSDGFAIFAEAKVRLLNKGHTYKEIPFTHVGRLHGHSKAFTLKNAISVIQTILVLLRDLML